VGIFLARAGKGTSWTSVWCAPSTNPAPSSVSWSADESRIVFSFDGSIYSLDVPDGQAATLEKGDNARWSSVDDRIAVLNGDEMTILNAGTRERHRFPIEGVVPSGLEWSPDGTYLWLVHRTRDQPHDSRTRTALGIVNTRTWEYNETCAKLWGVQPNLRFADLPPSQLGNIARIRERL
jgi:hypothetical protein